MSLLDNSVNEASTPFATSVQLYEHLSHKYYCKHCGLRKTDEVKEICKSCKTKKTIMRIVFIILAVIIYWIVEFATDLWFNPAYKKLSYSYTYEQPNSAYTFFHWILCIIFLFFLIVIAVRIPSKIYSKESDFKKTPDIPRPMEGVFANGRLTQGFFLCPATGTHMDNLASLYNTNNISVTFEINETSVNVFFNQKNVGTIPSSETKLFRNYSNIATSSCIVFKVSDYYYNAIIECVFSN